MRIWLFVLLLATALPGKSQSPITPGDAEVGRAVRTFARTVAHDVTGEGPSAWSRYFSEGPSFFMVVNGQMIFPNGAAARAAMPELQRRFRRIELEWGDDLRVDPLSPNLAVMAASYHEIQALATGETVDERGFFTGVAELRDGRWRFRDCHWSSVRPAAGR